MPQLTRALRVPGTNKATGWTANVGLLIPFFYVAWAVALAAHLGFAPLAGLLSVSLRGFYAFAAGLGWLAGNVYVLENRRLSSRKKRHLVFWFFGPPGLVHLLATTLSVSLQEAVPLLPLIGFGVFGVFFAVPVTFRKSLS